jgi:hypothetical protein
MEERKQKEMKMKTNKGIYEVYIYLLKNRVISVFTNFLVGFEI